MFSSGIVFLLLYSTFFPTYVQNKNNNIITWLCFPSVVLYGWLLNIVGVMDADPLSNQVSAYAVPVFSLESIDSTMDGVVL